MLRPKLVPGSSSWHPALEVVSGPGPGARSPSGASPPTSVQGHRSPGAWRPPLPPETWSQSEAAPWSEQTGSIRARPDWPRDAGWTLSSDPEGGWLEDAAGQAPQGAMVRGQLPAGRPGKDWPGVPVPGESVGPLMAQTGSAEPGLWPGGAASLCSPGAPWPGPRAPRWRHLAALAGLHSASSCAGTTNCCLKEGALVDPITSNESSLCWAKVTSTPRVHKVMSWYGRQWRLRV